MRTDEIVEETRRLRDEYASKFNYDLDLMFADLKRKEAESGREYISFVKETGDRKKLNKERKPRK
ncbi:MAG: hypothetical protein ACRD6X_07425 [Pyrinomonadaceae bacterium]